MTTTKRASQYRASLSQIKWILNLIFLILTAGTLSGGYFFYHYQSEAVRKATYRELDAIAQLKNSQIKLWREERISDARILSEDTYLAESYERWQHTPGKMADVFYLLSRLESIRKKHDYQQIFITTTDGRIVLPYSEDIQLIDPGSIDFIKKAVSDQTVIFGGFSFCRECNQIHVNLFAPLINIYGKSVAAVIMVIDPRYHLYPMIQSQPSESKSMETMIVRKENDQILLLNELRHSKDTAMKIKIPLSRTMLPSTQAVYGKQGSFEGVDYRGAEVLAKIRAIENSNWFMIVKVDTEEVFNQVDNLARNIIIVVILFLLTAGLGTGAVFHSRRKNLVRMLQMAESKEWLKTALYSIGAGVVVTDVIGRIRRMNPAAESLTGWSEKDAFDKPLDQLFQLVDESSGNEIKTPITQILQKATATHLARRCLLVDREGFEHPITESGACLYNKAGNAVGVVLVFQDQAEARKTERSLRQYRALNQSFMDNSPAMIYLIDRKGRFLMVNRKMASACNHCADEIIGKIREDFLPKTVAKEQNALDMMVLKNKTSRIQKLETDESDGKHIYLINRFPVFNEEGKIFAVGGIATEIPLYEDGNGLFLEERATADQ